MWAAVRSIAIATLLGCWMPPSMAAESPAQLVVGEDSIEELLRLPRLEPGRYTVHCEAQITRSGRAQDVYCYPMEKPVPNDLVKAIGKAASRAKFLPAVRAGEPIEVYAVFMVLVDTTLLEPMILAVPNNGVERQRLGLLYTSPQRLLEHSSSAMHPGRFVGYSANRFVMMHFQIDERGAVSNFELRNLVGKGEKNMQRYESVARDAARKYKFLPGYHEGRPVAMLYVEPFFSLY